jgi:hypothetical protein
LCGGVEPPAGGDDGVVGGEQFVGVVWGFPGFGEGCFAERIAGGVQLVE